MAKNNFEIILDWDRRQFIQRTYMHQFYIASIFASLLAFLLIGMWIFYKAKKPHYAFLIITFFLTLPMSPAMFYLIRLPIDRWILYLVGAKSISYAMISSLYAPLTEELAKIWPLLIPAFRQRIGERKVAILAALMLGLGFGIGEIWFVAHRVLQVNPASVAGYQWYEFVGFYNERFFVSFLHGAFTAFVLSRWKTNLMKGIFYAMILHYLLNFPILLGPFVSPVIRSELWIHIVAYWVMLYCLVMIFVVARMYAPRQKVSVTILGRALCPKCNQSFNRNFLFAFNLLHKRYERCPHCKKWSITSDAASDV